MDPLLRTVVVIGLAGIALVHVVDATGTFHETRYLGWAYMGLIVSCLAIAGLLIERDNRPVDRRSGPVLPRLRRQPQPWPDGHNMTILFA